MLIAAQRSKLDALGINVLDVRGKHLQADAGCVPVAGRRGVVQPHGALLPLAQLALLGLNAVCKVLRKLLLLLAHAVKEGAGGGCCGRGVGVGDAAVLRALHRRVHSGELQSTG